MIDSLNGILVHKDVNAAVIECSGVGFRCNTTLSTMSRLPAVGEKLKLFTHLNVREDGMELFGFLSREELKCFRQLTSVSGVGPKVGLAILSEISPERIALAVVSGDVKAITKAPGVGPKLAQRIILELKDKMKTQDAVKGMSQAPAESFQMEGSIGEAIGALIVLGYSQVEAASAVAKQDPSLPVEKLIPAALKYLSGAK